MNGCLRPSTWLAMMGVCHGRFGWIDKEGRLDLRVKVKICLLGCSRDQRCPNGDKKV
ncbi:hypothetical protein HanXRQr2_Chr17g0784501 [Helianthus annuus]|uniref:Uncharacterized protein n=1 Tax=Helianthus annuus TaxID=4232 RepID=A0A9K3GTI1_HELAN|nr:hypothetical protein HanXRQr2_Chr17g0784501 [Helianthus annuus]